MTEVIAFVESRARSKEKYEPEDITKVILLFEDSYVWHEVSRQSRSHKIEQFMRAIII